MADGWLLLLLLVVCAVGIGLFYSLFRNYGELGKQLKYNSLEEEVMGKHKILEHLPVGIALGNKEGKALWVNDELGKLLGKKITSRTVFSRLIPELDLSGEQTRLIQRSDRVLFVKKKRIPPPEEGLYLLTCEDLTEQFGEYKRSQEAQPAVALIQVDNLGEVLRSMTEEAKPHLLGALERLLGEWAGNLEGFLTKMGEGRYVVLMTRWGFKQAEKARFDLLDKVRELEAGNVLPLTLSVGIGINEESIGELGRSAQNALDIALERGGDQIVVKLPEHIRFYGGKSFSVEKKTKVKARVMAYALKELIGKSDQVIVMGHEQADFDSLGASLGMAKAVLDLGKKVWVIVDDHNPTTDKLIAALAKGPGEPAAALLRAQEALKKLTDNTLLVVVDTNKPSLLVCPQLLKKGCPVAVIDHHRRGEEFIEDAKLVYLETYASSTCELVTEMLQYLGDQVEIGRTEATALLAGITVDTKNFVVQTGVRTFQAASYLRSLGADPAIVQRLLSDDINTIIKKAEVIRNARILYGEMALGISRERNHDAQPLAAKTADAMLNIAGVSASFVLWPYENGIAVSARSNGEINVQVIMEKLGGGGHLTIAAAQLPTTLEEAEKRLLDVLEEEYHKEGLS